MSYWSHTPRGRLGSLVRSIWAARHATVIAPLPGLIAPDAHVEFVFQLEAPCEMQRAGASTWEPLPKAMLYAQRSACVRLRSTGPSSMVAFRTTAVVAALLLRRPMRDLWDAPIALRDLLGPSIEPLHEQLALGTVADRFALIEAWLERRLTAWNGDHDRTDRLHELLFWRSTGTRIRVTAARIGVTERSLRRWIEAPTGLAPKQLELAGRLLRGCALLREEPTAAITSIAYRLGFADHAAFSNAFRRRTGLSPREFRDEPLVFYERGPV